MKLTKEQVNKFWAKVKKTRTCWLWAANTDGWGYGKVKIDNIELKAHRVSWGFVNGEIPKGLCVLHACDVPACVNPKHLWLGTLSDNTQDCIKKKRHYTPFAQKGGNPATKLTPRQVREIRKKYIKGKYGQVRLAKEYNVGKNAIQSIVTNKTWRHLL